MPKVSVIIPVYNAEKYLDQCLQSVLSQSFTDFELLLINDGSKDRSGEICEAYATKDSRVKVFHQENKGVSAARNLGLDKATGEWICFVDSDDWVGEGYFNVFLEFDQSEIDWILLNIYRKGYSNSVIINYNDKIISKKDYLKTHTLYPYLSGPWGKFYRTGIIQEGLIRFIESIHLGEDVIFNTHYLFHINNIKLYSKTNYFYRDTPGSLTKLEQFNFEEELNLYSHIKVGLQNIAGSINISEHMVYTMSRVQKSIYSNFTGKERREVFKDILKKEYKAYSLLYKNTRFKYLLWFYKVTNSIYLLDFALVNYRKIKKA